MTKFLTHSHFFSIWWDIKLKEAQMEVLTRDAAVAAGSVKFFTGRPCKRGHIAERFVSNGNCVVCNGRHQFERKSSDMLRLFRSLGMESFTHWYHPEDKPLIDALVLELQNGRINSRPATMRPTLSPEDRLRISLGAERLSGGLDRNLWVFEPCPHDKVFKYDCPVCCEAH